VRSFYIKGTDKRYSIREDGNVIRHYRYNCKGIRVYKDEFCKKTKRKGSSIVSVTIYNPEGIGRRKVVNELMVEYFDLKLPDDCHSYFFDYKDGDCYNNGLTNIYYRIFTRKEYKYDPQCYYVDGDLVEKRCGTCGDKKVIKNFTVYPKSNTCSNECNTCRSKDQYAKIKSDKLRYSKSKKRTLKWNASDTGKKWRSEYFKMQREFMSNWYINGIIRHRGENPDHYTEEMKEIVRTQILMHREIEKQKEKG